MNLLRKTITYFSVLQLGLVTDTLQASVTTETGKQQSNVELITLSSSSSSTCCENLAYKTKPTDQKNPAEIYWRNPETQGIQPLNLNEVTKHILELSPQGEAGLQMVMVFCGPMYACKTLCMLELIKAVSQNAKQFSVVVAKCSPQKKDKIDRTNSAHRVKSRALDEQRPVDLTIYDDTSVSEIVSGLPANPSILFVDEYQFMKCKLGELLQSLGSFPTSIRGLVLSGLDKDCLQAGWLPQNSICEFEQKHQQSVRQYPLVAKCTACERIAAIYTGLHKNGILFMQENYNGTTNPVKEGSEGYSPFCPRCLNIYQSITQQKNMKTEGVPVYYQDSLGYIAGDNAAATGLRPLMMTVTIEDKPTNVRLITTDGTNNLEKILVDDL
ncbi:MAG: hypothetical protein LBF56_03360 [Holosporales bacterium]|jgi:thymidine kinase|nr:hypothetical protein [Holosporales bacterium]